MSGEVTLSQRQYDEIAALAEIGAKLTWDCKVLGNSFWTWNGLEGRVERQDPAKVMISTVSRPKEPLEALVERLQQSEWIVCAEALRVLEDAIAKPKCPKCKGKGTIGGNTGFNYDYPTTCGMCGGTGERDETM
jgi:hypothetical protein